MHIILVSRRQKTPKTYDLSQRSIRIRLAAAAVAAALLLAGMGAAVAMVVASPRDRAVAQIKALHHVLARQGRQLTEVRGDARRDINALAVKLGELQAQSVRLNALGERLAEAGKLDQAEFDFDQPPSLGGPDSGAEAGYALPVSLDRSIDHLARTFDGQRSQLTALEDMLLDRKVASSLRPTGMPVSGYISSYFGRRVDPFNGHRAFHAGLDIATPDGSAVHAVAEGIVTYAGRRRGYGNVVEVDHGNGYMTRFAHNSVLMVHAGERVRIGQMLARSGSTGRSTGPHVHFEVWYKGRPVNPLAYVRSHR